MTADTLEEGQDAAPETTPAKPKKGAMKDDAPEYIVLSLQTENAWVHRGPVAARSAEQAIRNFAAGASVSETVTLVAIPSRSFRPVTVTPKTVTSLVIEEASS